MEQQKGFHPVENAYLKWEKMRGRNTSPEVVRDSLKYVRHKRLSAVKESTVSMLKGTGDTLLGTAATAGILGIIGFNGAIIGIGAGIVAEIMGIKGDTVTAIATNATWLGSVITAGTTYSSGMKWALGKIGKGLFVEALGAPVKYAKTMHEARRNGRLARSENSRYPLY